jgi:hypothetical protein
MGLNKDYAIDASHFCGYSKKDPYNILFVKGFDGNNIDHLKILVHVCGSVNVFRPDRMGILMNILDVVLAKNEVASVDDTLTTYKEHKGMTVAVEDTGTDLRVYHLYGVVCLVQGYISDELYDKLVALPIAERAKVSALIVQMYNLAGSISANIEGHLTNLCESIINGKSFEEARNTQVEVVSTIIAEA